MIEITTARPGDIPAIARLHVQAFTGFFLTSLGQAFLRELYTGFLTQPSGILIVARQQSEIIGFAAGTTAPETFFSGLRRRRWASFLLKATPAVLINPVPVVKKLVGALFYRGDAPQSSCSGALLSSIGVSPQFHGQAIGDALMAAFEKAAAKAGAESVYLTTDADSNERVNAFYRRNAYRIDCRFLQQKRRPMIRYIKALSR